MVDLARYEGRKSRNAGEVLSLADLAEHGFEGVADPEPTPELAAQVSDECRRLLDVLDDDTLRSVAIWKLEGYTNHEIAGKLQCVDQTVERKLRTIRSIWAREARSDGADRRPERRDRVCWSVCCRGESNNFRIFSQRVRGRREDLASFKVGSQTRKDGLRDRDLPDVNTVKPGSA